MQSLRQMKDFPFYANLYPIIKDEGWEVGHLSYGSVNFLRKIDFIHNDRECSYIVGILVGNGWWKYCYNATLYTCLLGGGGLNIPLTTPHKEVYRIAKQMAIQRIDNEIKKIQEEIAKHDFK